MELIVDLLLLLLGIYIIYLFVYTLTLAAPYAPLSDERIKVMLKLLQLKKGQKMADIGSGDGRIVIAFAKKGIESHGYEINPLLVIISKWYIRKYNLQTKAFVHWESLWRTNFSTYDALTLFGITHMMPRLEKKLRQELKPGSKVVSNHFQFPTWKPRQTNSDVRLYIQK